MSRKSKAAEFLDEGYNINILGRHVMVTDAMKAYALEKISKIERFTNRIIDINIVMDIQKIEHKVEITMKVGHIVINCSAVSEDMYASIDLATEKLQKRLLKYKKRIQEHSAKSLSMIDMNVNVLNVASIDEINEEIEEENMRELIDSYTHHEIVSTEKKPLKILRTDEALMKLDLSGDHFLIYRCEEDQKLKIVYKQNQGNFAVIEVES